MGQAIKTMDAPQGGVGRLHLEGKTIGADPFPEAVRRRLREWGYALDSLNWIYWKRFPDDDTALDEMTRLDGWRKGFAESLHANDRELADVLQVRVMQDPVLEDGWDAVEHF
jgi:hypothetical protein